LVEFEALIIVTEEYGLMLMLASCMAYCLTLKMEAPPKCWAASELRSITTQNIVRSVIFVIGFVLLLFLSSPLSH
jgi:hypothetical protein